MKMLIWILLCMAPALSARAETPSTGIALEHVDTRFELKEGYTYPSCKMFEYRRKERQKVLRELKYKTDQVMASPDKIWMDNYILNQYFMEKELWNDEVVSVVNTWKTTAEFAQEFARLGLNTFVELSGDSILWREHMDRFPNEVTFEVSPALDVIVSRHKAYYADYCQPHYSNELTWYPQPQKIKIELPPTTTAEISALVQIIK